MKKILLNFFIAIIVTLSFAVLFVNSSFAQTQIQSANVDYQLPYPGLLPDNPLYVLKTFRDKVISFFIADPLKKSEFDLLQADKRLSVGMALFDKEEKDLSEQTISKGENYFDDAIKNVKVAKKEGREIDPVLLQNLQLSSKKHKEVLQDLVQRSSGSLKQKFQAELKRASKFVEDVGELTLK